MADRCNLCGSTTRTPGYLVAGQLVYARCATCGLIVQDPLPAVSELAEIYRNYFRQRGMLRGREYGYPDYDRERSVQTFRRHYLGWFRRHGADRGGRFLDFGCGTGNLVQLLRAEGFDAVGCEFSEQAIAILAARGVPHFRSDELAAIPHRFASVSMLDVIEHLHDPARDLAAIHRAMQDGGLLFIETVNADDVFARFLYRGRWQGISPVHLYLFGGTTLARLLRDRGFEILEMRTYRMSGAILARTAMRAASYAIRAASPLLGRRARLLGYSTDRLRRFAASEPRSPYQFSLGDGLRVVARKPLPAGR